MASTIPRHHNPLADDLIATGPLRTRSKKRKDRRDEDGAGYVDAKSSRKILKLGEELAEEDREASNPILANPAFSFASRFDEGSEPEDAEAYDREEAWGDEEEEEVEEAEVDPKDLDLFNKFVPPGEQPSLKLHHETPKEVDGTNLADLILQQIAAHEEGRTGQPEILGGGLPEDAIEIPVKVVEVYTKVGMILSRYKSGRLPKPFKILPTLPHWEDLLSITRPEQWTPNACYEATRIFVSSNPNVVRRFLETVILEIVREDIHETKKLNVHLYKSLQKATYKPAAFFKGILFPLIESGTCTLREAHIISSVITRCSIPPLHSSAALMRLTDIAAEQASVATEGGGATNMFIKAFLEKKYALPYKVIDNLVFHFLRFRSSDPSHSDEAMADVHGQAAKEAKLPVLWHQSLLAFAQRYRDDITEDQRESLLDLVLVLGHRDIGPEVRRELLQGRGRGVPLVAEAGFDGGDDTMIVDPV